MDAGGFRPWHGACVRQTGRETQSGQRWILNADLTWHGMATLLSTAAATASGAGAGTALLDNCRCYCRHMCAWLEGCVLHRCEPTCRTIPALPCRLPVCPPRPHVGCGLAWLPMSARPAAPPRNAPPVSLDVSQPKSPRAGRRRPPLLLGSGSKGPPPALLQARGHGRHPDSLIPGFLPSRSSSASGVVVADYFPPPEVPPGFTGKHVFPPGLRAGGLRALAAAGAAAAAGGVPAGELRYKGGGPRHTRTT
jgi:hypothetical protein